MSPPALDTLRKHLQDALQQHGDSQPLADDDSLFLSGRLDSFSMMNLILFLETTFQSRFSDLEFDDEKVDSVHAIAARIHTPSP